MTSETFIPKDLEIVSADPREQRDYEFFSKGYDNGIYDEKERIIELIDTYVAELDNQTRCHECSYENDKNCADCWPINVVQEILKRIKK